MGEMSKEKYNICVKFVNASVKHPSSIGQRRIKLKKMFDLDHFSGSAIFLKSKLI